MVAERRIWRNLVGGVFSWLLAAIVGTELHAQPRCVALRRFCNKVSTVPKSPWPKVSVQQKFEIQIQISNRFYCNRFCINFRAQNVVRKHLKFELWTSLLLLCCSLHPGRYYTKRIMLESPVPLPSRPCNPSRSYADFRYKYFLQKLPPCEEWACLGDPPIYTTTRSKKAELSERR